MTSPTVDILFSDIDGTLVHYPKHFNEYAELISEDTSLGTATIRYKHTGEQCLCKILSSTTSGDAYISLRTIELIAQLRDTGTRFVLITGARSSTYAKRRTLLPLADFEFYENGGRKVQAGVVDPEWTDNFKAQVGQIDDRSAFVPDLPPPDDRTGSLWRLHNSLVETGWKVDARDYATSFRVDIARSIGHDHEEFRGVLARELESRGLSSSFNLGKADIYPETSGKANAARHILEVCQVKAEDSVAMFDDDNDLELGALCGAGFLPGVTHASVLDALKQFPKWSLMDRKGVLGTEDALERIVQLRHKAVREGRAKFVRKIAALAK